MNDTMQILTAKRVADHNDFPTYDVSSDETGFIGNYLAEDEADAIEQARENVL